uniref:Uncharacterized protein n=1 Tax=Globodera rostochiensis TaxID=31243 RepID=A0A914H977_GLORO
MAYFMSHPVSERLHRFRSSSTAACKIVEDADHALYTVTPLQKVLDEYKNSTSAFAATIVPDADGDYDGATFFWTPIQMTQRQLAADLTTTCGGWAVEMAIFGNSNGHIGDEEEWEDTAERIVRISVEWRLLAAADQTPALLRERMDALIAAASAAALATINGRMTQVKKVN